MGNEERATEEVSEGWRPLVGQDTSSGRNKQAVFFCRSTAAAILRSERCFTASWASCFDLCSPICPPSSLALSFSLPLSLSGCTILHCSSFISYGFYAMQRRRKTVEGKNTKGKVEKNEGMGEGGWKSEEGQKGQWSRWWLERLACYCCWLPRCLECQSVKCQCINQLFMRIHYTQGRRERGRGGGVAGGGVSRQRLLPPERKFRTEINESSHWERS